MTAEFWFAKESVYYVGPQLRADYWEATAAQELRSHAERVASRLAGTKTYSRQRAKVAAGVAAVGAVALAAVAMAYYGA